MSVSDLSHARRQVIQQGHGNAIQALRFLPDGEHFISAGSDGSVLVWHTRSGTLVRVLAEGEGELGTLDISACGRWLLYAVPYRGVTVLTWPSGDIAAELDCFPGGVMAACFSPDGERIAIGHGRLWAKERSLELWRWREPRCERVFFENRLEKFEGTRGQVSAMAFSPDGRTLAAGISNQLHVWGPDWTIGVPAHGLVLTELAWSPKGDFLVTAGCDKRVALWRTGAQAPEREWSFSHFETGCVKGLAIRPDGGEIATVCDTRLMLIDLATGEEQSHYFGNVNAIPQALAYAPGGDRLAISLGQDWQIWQDSSPMLAPSTTRLCAFAGAHILADGTLLAVTHDGRAVRWEDEIDIFPEPEERYARSALSPDGRWCLSSAWGVGPPLLADLNQCERHPIALSPFGNYNRITFTRHWGVLVDTRLHLLIRVDPATRATEKAFTGVKQVSALAAATATDLVVLGDCYEGRLTLWDMDTPRQVSSFPFRHSIDACFALSPDGTRLLAAANHADDRQIHLLNPADGNVKESFDAPAHGRVVSIAFAPDGERFATGHDDGRTVLWRIGQPRPLAVWKGDGSWVHALAFSPDGETLASGGNSLRVRSTCDGTERARLYLFESGGWAVAEPSGRVVTSPDAAGYVVVVRDGVPLSEEQEKDEGQDTILVEHSDGIMESNIK